ncbi:MAG: threonine aldolase family protein [Sphaerochaetaceae bacterium]|jgi:threonine aldolase
MNNVDLRSDTLTMPTPHMREAMAQAEVGDDVYLEDPTINRLQEMGASLLGKEAALFVSSGSMGNLIPLYIQANKGREVLAHKDAHIIHHEVGAVSGIASTLPIGLDTPKGILTSEAIEEAIKPDLYFMTKTALIEIENSINGIFYPKKNLDEIQKVATKHNIPIHIDGARLWNASIASKMSLKELASYGDTVTVCLSKGMGAPVGSILAGTQKFINEARVVRKMLGGGMRHAGILAAAGIYAIEHNYERLEVDHVRAYTIAKALSETSWASLDIEDVQTNMVFFSVENTPAQKVVDVFEKHHILCMNTHANVIRLVTHLNLSDEDIDSVVEAIRTIKEEEFM